MMRRILTTAIALLAGAALAGEPHQLPDPKLTPGAVRADMTVAEMCATKWGRDARAVSARLKAAVIAAYGITPSDCPSGKIEVDHLVSRELLGADVRANLWAQCYEAPVYDKDGKQLPYSTSPEWGAHKKDRLENALHVAVCAGELSLAKAQAMLRTDWIAAYKRWFGS
jgi:hypothetical protein